MYICCRYYVSPGLRKLLLPIVVPNKLKLKFIFGNNSETSDIPVP